MPVALPVVHMYVDDSGTTRGDSFVVGMFCTTDDMGWRQRFQQSLDAERYPNTLHFKQLSSNPRQGRYRVSKRLLALLSTHSDWWCHFIYVDRSLLDEGFFSKSAQVEYNQWVADLIRRNTRRAEYAYRVTLAHRDRLRTDDFIPEQLQLELDELRALEGAPEVKLATRLSRQDRMLQIADLLISAIHQTYRPSGNPIKRELAALVDTLVKRPEAKGDGRIYPQEWRPDSRAGAKRNEG